MNNSHCTKHTTDLVKTLNLSRGLKSIEGRQTAEAGDYELCGIKLLLVIIYTILISIIVILLKNARVPKSKTVLLPSTHTHKKFQ